jgi:phage shock protein A
MTAIDDLEQLDRTIQQVTGLLSQADQAVEQALQAASGFYASHGANVPSSPLLHQALTDIQTNLHSLTDQHNQLVGQIAQARTEAQQIPDNPY